MRMLRVLHDLFYQPMADGGFFPLEELQNIFPSLDELIEVHCECQPRPFPSQPTTSSLPPLAAWPAPGDHTFLSPTACTPEAQTHKQT